jgi:hypothetical protein
MYISGHECHIILVLISTTKSFISSYRYGVANPSTYIDRCREHSVIHVSRACKTRIHEQPTSSRSLMHSIHRIEQLASKQPGDISYDIDCLLLTTTHSEDNGNAKANSRSDNFTVAWILVGSTSAR